MAVPVVDVRVMRMGVGVRRVGQLRNRSARSAHYTRTHGGFRRLAAISPSDYPDDLHVLNVLHFTHGETDMRR